jgi:hypothetical protein
MGDKKREDFVKVRLSEHGRELAGEGPIVVQEGHHEFILAAGEELDVTRAFDWQRILSRQHRDGKPLFELVPETSGTEEN